MVKDSMTTGLKSSRIVRVLIMSDHEASILLLFELFVTSDITIKKEAIIKA